MSDKPEHSSRSENPLAQVTWQRIVVRQSSVWRPPTDVYQADDRLIVIIEIAGMRDGDFQIVLQNRRLTVSGVRKHSIEHPNMAYHQLEIPRGDFRTEVYLPWNVQRDQVSATYRDGMLKIELPQAKAQQIHIIDVSTEE
jgi:HSP20 family protein